MIFDIVANVADIDITMFCDSLESCANSINLTIFSQEEICGISPVQFASFNAIKMDTNLNLARQFNRAIASGKEENIILFNGITHVLPGFVIKLQKALNERQNCCAFAIKAYGSKAQYHVDPISLKTFTLGENACLVRRTYFKKAGGFDPTFDSRHMWNELSLRLCAMGGIICHTPMVCVIAKQEHVNALQARQEYAEGQKNNLLLSFKYENRKMRWQAQKQYFESIKNPKSFPNIRTLLLQNGKSAFLSSIKLRKWRRENVDICADLRKLPQNVQKLEIGISPLLSPIIQGPKISVVMRTCGRQTLLCGALQSVANQSYQNYEIIVVEDGRPMSQQMILQQFSHLPITYYATGEKVGRSRAGNIGLEKAEGEYINFLDDDDYFYPDHLEHMAAKMLENPDADLILGCSVAMFTDKESAEEEARDNARYSLVKFDRIDAFTMCQMCQIPLLSAAFKRQLFLKCGGLKEGMDAHEDWAMWLKFFAVAKRANPFGPDITRATTVFLQPDSEAQAQRRLKAYKKFDEMLFLDPEMRFNPSLADMRSFYKGMIADMLHLKKLGRLDEFLEGESQHEEKI